MYWPTSFCERENSSKRWRISSVRVTAGLTERVTADCFGPGGCVPAKTRRSDHNYTDEGRLTRPVRALLLTAAFAVLTATGTAGASTLPYPTACGVELSRAL